MRVAIPISSARLLRQNAVAIALAASANAVALLALLDFVRIDATASTGSAPVRVQSRQSVTIVHLPRVVARATQLAHRTWLTYSDGPSPRPDARLNVEAGGAPLGVIVGISTLPVAPGDPNRPRRDPITTSGNVVAAAANASIRSAIQSHNDSVARSEGRPGPGDWSVMSGDKRYGMAPGMLHLGAVTIPLPIQFRTTLYGEGPERAAAARQSEIVRQARRAEDAALFKQAVRDTRLRIDLERRRRDETQLPPNDHRDL